MEEKILIALDDSQNAIRTVEFITRIFSPGGKDFVLFSIVPDMAALCDMNSPELTPYFLSQDHSFMEIREQKRNALLSVLENAKNILTDAGFDPNRIHIKIQDKKKGIARDIIDEAYSGYTLIAMGRRGLSGVEEFLFGSVSQKVIHTVKGVSVLIVN